MEQRLINANALIRRVNDNEFYSDKLKRAVCFIVDIAPDVDAVPVVRGEWKLIESELPWIEYRCSECGTYSKYATHYCPNCGAKMDGERKDGEHDRI